jgi:pyrroloquinoline quinone (PQQ) biosynthesis protein C
MTSIKPSSPPDSMDTQMHLYERLRRETSAERDYLLAAPAIQRALAGDVDRSLYVAFLTQAYHHVRHTVPLLMAVGARIPERHEWLREPILHYLDEERGHEQWILNDIAQAGGDREAAAASQPSVATECMVAYAYDMIERRNPLGFFGMVFVLEGTSVALALNAAGRIQSQLQLPVNAFSYLRSHGELDQEHVGDLEAILGRVVEAEDCDAVIRCAKAMYWLYGNMFRGLDGDVAARVEPAAMRLSA